jgi:hypothetical protein
MYSDTGSMAEQTTIQCAVQCSGTVVRMIRYRLLYGARSVHCHFQLTHVSLVRIKLALHMNPNIWIASSFA